VSYIKIGEIRKEREIFWCLEVKLIVLVKVIMKNTRNLRKHPEIADQKRRTSCSKENLKGLCLLYVSNIENRLITGFVANSVENNKSVHLNQW
jgi:hypothetical protein